MAMMSQRAGAYKSSSATGSNRGRTQRNRQRLLGFDEHFRPVSQWKTENDALILEVRLPGFLKEQINLSKDDSKRLIRIYGERALADNRRIRFNTTYTIPQTTNFSQMTTHFDRGILKITIPKLCNLTTTPANIPQQNEEATTSQEKPIIELQKTSDHEQISTLGTEKQVADVRVAKEESLELKKEEYGADPDKEMLVAGKKLVREEKDNSDVDAKEKLKEENEVKKERRREIENVEMGKKQVGEDREEKQLVVNICVAVMVIVGLGLDLFFTFG